MITRDESLLKIRPILNLNVENSSALEEFQCTTLRPILKLQNQIIVNLFKEHLTLTKKQISLYDTRTQKSIVREAIAKNHNLRNSLVHTVICMMTNDEFGFYSNNKKEVSKRIISMVQKRLQDNLELLY